MLRSAWYRRVALIVALFAVSVPTTGYAQSTASISGVVKDTAGGVLPGVTVVIKNDASGASQEVTSPTRREIPGHGPWSRVLHRDGDAHRVQDGDREEHPGRARPAGHHPADARNRAARRDGHRHEQLGARQQPRTERSRRR